MPPSPRQPPEVSAEDLESLRWMYQPLVDAAVQTRKDMDQFAFRYVATLTTLTVAVASEGVDVSGWVAKSAMSVLALVVAFVAVSALRTRERVYHSINNALVKIETALGGFEESRYVPGAPLFDWRDETSAVSATLRGQVKPHLAGVLTIGALCIGAVLVDG